jgi:hypothetical protein
MPSSAAFTARIVTRPFHRAGLQRSTTAWDLSRASGKLHAEGRVRVGVAPSRCPLNRYSICPKALTSVKIFEQLRYRGPLLRDGLRV